MKRTITKTRMLLVIAACLMAAAPARAAGWRYPWAADDGNTRALTAPSAVAPATDTAHFVQAWSYAGAGTEVAADIDGDGDGEVVIATDANTLKAISATGTMKWFANVTTDSGAGGGTLYAALGDATGDGIPEIFAYRNFSSDGNVTKVTAYTGAGVFIKNFSLPNSLGITDLKIADIDLDGTTEVIVAVHAGGSLTPRGIYVFNYTTSAVKWSYNFPLQSIMLAIGNIDGDAYLEVLAGGFAPHNGASANGMTDNYSYVLALKYDGTVKWTRQVADCTTMPYIADINNDGSNEVVALRSQASYYPGTNQILTLDPASGNTILNYDTGSDDAGRVYVSIADVTGTGNKELIASRGDGYVIMVDSSLSFLRQYATGFANYTTTLANDIDNDGKDELVVVPYQSSTILALNSTLDPLWSYTLPAQMNSNWVYGGIASLATGGTNEIFLPTDATTYVLTGDFVPPAFAGVQNVVGCGSGCLDLSWSAATDAQGSTPITYNIYMSTTSGGQNFASADFSIASTSIQINSGILDDTPYYFVVRAKDSAGNEEPGATETVGVPTTIPSLSKYGGNPILIPGSGFDSVNVSSVNVIKDGSLYKMWYAGWDGSRGRTGYAISSDGVNWTKFTGAGASGSVLEPGTGFESQQVVPTSVVWDGSMYRMWYTASNGVTPTIGYAISSDGISWAKNPSPVLSSGPGGFDVSNVASPSVILDGGIYKMWYRGMDVSHIGRIGYATSLDGISWTKVPGDKTGGSVLDLGSGFDNTYIDGARVYKDNSVYKMIYLASDGSKEREGYAISPDGIHWTKHPNPACSSGCLIDGDTTFDMNGASLTSFAISGGAYDLWYTGKNASNQYGLGYANSSGSFPPALTSIAITPSATATVGLGMIRQYTAMCTYSTVNPACGAMTCDCTNTVSWNSDTPSVATIGQLTGLATGVAGGISNITASNNQGMTSSPIVLSVDANPPTVLNNMTGGDDNWHNTDPGTVYDVDFSDTGGSNLNNVQYTIWSGPNMTGGEVIAWSNIYSGINAATYTADWGVNFNSLAMNASSLSKRYVSARAYDNAGNVSAVATDVFYIYITPWDLTGNGQINAADAGLFFKSFGFMQGDPEFNPNADFTKNNRVDMSDFLRLRVNYPLFKTGSSTDLLSSNPIATLTISAATSPVLVNSVVPVTVTATYSGDTTKAADLFLNFDPAYLQVTDASGTPITTINTSGNAFGGNTIYDTVNNASGTISVSPVSTAAPVASGGSPITVMSFYVKPVATGTTNISFAFDGASNRYTRIMSATDGTTDLFATATNKTFTIEQPSKIVSIDPADGTVDAPITARFEVQDAGGVLTATDTVFTVNLSGSAIATSATTGSILGGANTNTINVQAAIGVVELSVSDTVAESVGISLADSSATGLDVSSTQNVTFAPGVPTQVVLVNPSNTTIGSNTTVTANVADQYGNVNTASTATFTVNASGSGKFTSASTGTLLSGANTGIALMQTSSGTVSLSLTDSVAETVMLSLSDTNGTGYVMTSMQDAIFSLETGNKKLCVLASGPSYDAGTPCGDAVNSYNGSRILINFQNGCAPGTTYSMDVVFQQNPASKEHIASFQMSLEYNSMVMSNPVCTPDPENYVNDVLVTPQCPAVYQGTRTYLYMAEANLFTDIWPASNPNFSLARIAFSNVNLTEGATATLTFFTDVPSRKNKVTNAVADVLTGTITADVTCSYPPPVLTDNQADDDTLHAAANTTLYNVDAMVPYNLPLESIQVRACSTAANCGDNADWTNIASGIASSTYSTDWQLPPTLWNALPDGTSYISVRAITGNSKVAEIGNAFYVKKKTSAPSLAIITPSIGANVSGSVQITGTVADSQLHDWTLYYGPGASPTAWNPVCSGTSTVASGTLCTWSAGGLAGSYTLKLEASDIVGNTSNSTISVNLNNTATISGTIPAFQWTLVSVPVQPLSSTPAAMFGSGNYQIYRWEPDSPQDPSLDHFVVPKSLAAGQAFWIKSYGASLPYSYNGTIIDTTTNYSVPLKSGWNQVGAPFNDDFPWGVAQVKYQGVTYDLATAANMGIISTTIYNYDTGVKSWAQTTAGANLTKQTGYDIYAFNDVELVFGPGAGKAGGIARQVRTVYDYKIKISATGASSADIDNYIGSVNLASEQYDAFDALEPPRSLESKYTSLYFPRDSWTKNAGRYANDFRASAKDSGQAESWPFDVETNDTGTITLKWDSSALPIAEYSFTLVNVDTGERINMAERSSYTYTAAGATNDNHFKIEVVKLNTTLVTKTHTLQPGWNLISVPVEPQLTGALAQLGDDLPLFNVYQYFGGKFYNADSADIQAGLGYWVYVADNTQIDIVGLPVASGASITVPLKPGWNIIGNPFEAPLAWGDNVKLSCAGVASPLSQAVAAGSISASLFGFDGNAYTPLAAGAQLEPWRGYMVRSAVLCDLILSR